MVPKAILAPPRDRAILGLVLAGVPDAEIGKRVGRSRARIGQIVSAFVEGTRERLNGGAP